MNTKLKKMLRLITLFVIALVAFTSVALAQDDTPVASDEASLSMLKQMQEQMGPEAWATMIAHMMETHGPEFTAQMMARMNKSDICHGDGFMGMMGQGHEEGFWGHMKNGLRAMMKGGMKGHGMMGGAR